MDPMHWVIGLGPVLLRLAFWFMAVPASIGNLITLIEIQARDA